jgi:hypothetical protein
MTTNVAFESRQKKKYFSPPLCPDWLWTFPVYYLMSKRDLFHDVKAARA